MTRKEAYAHHGRGGVRIGTGNDCVRCVPGHPGPAAANGSAADVAARERRGLIWIGTAFLICPCHLPLTLALASALLAGTAIGASITAHPIIVGVAISLAWLAATARGFQWLRTASRRRREPSRA